jgi:hypothetical protein
MARLERARARRNRAAAGRRAGGTPGGRGPGGARLRLGGEHEEPGAGAAREAPGCGWAESLRTPKRARARGEPGAAGRRLQKSRERTQAWSCSGRVG